MHALSSDFVIQKRHWKRGGHKEACGKALVHKDLPKAMHYFALAVSNGVRFICLVLGQLHMGEFGNAEEGVQRNPSEAHRYWELLVNAPDGLVESSTVADGYFQLGRLYRNGDYEPASRNTWLEYYKTAARMGQVESQFELGITYYTGRDGLDVDYEQGLQYHHAAASQGLADAQYALGMHHMHGGLRAQQPHTGFCPVSFSDARQNLETAAAQGHTLAQEALKALALLEASSPSP